MNQTLGHTAMDIHQKRRLDGSSSDSERVNKRPRHQWYVRLASESSVASEEDTESISSIQGRETDLAKDSSDTDTKSESGSSVGSGYEVAWEFDVASTSEDENKPFEDCTSDSDITTASEIAVAAVLCDSSLERWASRGEDSDTSGSESFSRTDFRTCAQCKSKNDNPLYRLCGKCFQEKKVFYPPRPKPQKKRRKAVTKEVSVDRLKSCLSSLSQDSGVGSTQEIGIDFERIQIPSQKSSQSTDSLVSISSQGSVDDETDEKKSQPIVEIDCGNGTDFKRIQSPSQGSSQNIITDSQGSFDDEIDGKESQVVTTCSSSIDFKRIQILSQESLQSVDSLLTASSQGSLGDGTDVIDSQPTVEIACSSPAEDLFKIPKLEIITTTKLDALERECEEKMKADVTNNIASKELKNSVDMTKAEELCFTCNVKPRNCAFLHGKSGHVCCCYRCGSQIFKKRRRCPICNRIIHNIVKLYSI